MTDRVDLDTGFAKLLAENEELRSKVARVEAEVREWGNIGNASLILAALNSREEHNKVRAAYGSRPFVALDGEGN